MGTTDGVICKAVLTYCKYTSILKIIQKCNTPQLFPFTSDMRTCTKKQQHEIEISTKQLHKILIFLQIFLVNVIITRFPGRVEIRDYIRPVPILPVGIIFQRFRVF